MSDYPGDNTKKTDGFGIGEAGSVPDSTPMDDLIAARLQPMKTQRMVKCNCGHTVAANLVMSASNGTSCPDCYDNMSD